MRKLYTVLLITTSLQLLAQNRLHIEHLTLEDGLSQNQVLSIVQDKRGFMWFGTQDGLNRYDGYKFTAFRYDANQPNSLPSGYFHDLCEDKDGYLWVLAVRGISGEVARFNPATNCAETFRFNPNNKHGLSSNFIACLHYNHLGQLWIGTDNGLNLFLPQTKSFKRFLYDSTKDNTRYRPQKGIQVFTILTDANGVLWVGTNRGLGILDTKTGRWTKVPLTPNSKSEESIKTIYQDKNQTIWVGTATKGLFELLPDKKTFKAYAFDPKNTNSISNNTINSILEDKNHQLWITTENGVNILNRKTGVFKRYYPIPGDRNSLTTANRTRIYEDKEGIIWLGGAKSLERYNPRRKYVQLFYPIPNDENSLNNPSIFSFAEDETGNIWIATHGGINVLDRKTGKFSHYVNHPNDANSLPENLIWGLIFDEKGRLWVKTNSQGITCLDKKTGKFTHYQHDPENANSLSDNEGFCICLDSVGRFWFGTLNGLNYFDEKTNRFIHYFSKPNDPTTISNNHISTIYKDGHGDVWAGTVDGLNRWNRKTNTFTRFQLNPKDRNSVINKMIYCITEDKHGNLWVGGPDGMSRYNASTNQFHNYTEQSGLPNNAVYNIIPDDKNRLWLSTNHGIAAFNLTDSTFRYFGPSDGLQSWEFNGASAYRSPRTGELFFGGIAGFNIFHPDSIGTNPFIPPVYITSLRRYIMEGPRMKAIETANITNLRDITFPHNAGQLTFEFAALSFSNPKKNQYTYQLKGYNDQWIPLETRREVTFVGLPSGDYTLRIKGSNGDGLWNDTPTELRITILPPWWRTWWAYLLYLGLFAFALNRYIHYRSNKLKAENVKLEEKVSQRTNELEQSLKDLKTTQAQLIQSEKLASLGELTAGIAHEIQNPLNFVNNFAEVSAEMLDDMQEELEKGDTTEAIVIATDLKTNLKKINHHGQRASSIVKGMLEHSRASTGVKEPTDLNALADEYLRLAYHGLRAKDNNFNATLETHFDPDLPLVSVIPQDIGRVLLNLINNAFYAVAERSRSTVHQRTVETLHAKSLQHPPYQPIVTVSTQKTGNQIIIRVQDNGNGIPEAIKDKIFQPFFTTKPTGQGTGLGLSLAYDIVTKAHGGNLSVDSTEGEGTKFTISLPTLS